MEGAEALPWFPNVKLRRSKVEDLKNQERELMTRYLRLYEEVSSVSNAELVWKHQWEYLSEYSSDEIQVFTKNQAGSKTPLVLVIGLIHAQLSDLLYGSMWTSTLERRSRGYYSKDGLVDGSLLYPLEAPSSRKPFRTLAVKWERRLAPKKSFGLARDRDLCCLQSTGTLRSGDGDTVGFELKQSVAFPSCPPGLDGSAGDAFVRAQVSSGSFFRQPPRHSQTTLDDAHVQVFLLGSLDPSGDMGRRLRMKLAVQTFKASLEGLHQVAIAKKLARVVETGPRNLVLEASMGSDTTASSRHSNTQCACGMCDAKSERAARAKEKCRICQQACCASCLSKREVGPLRMTEQWAVEVLICKSCFHSAISKDATLFAIEDVRHRHQIKISTSPFTRYDLDNSRRFVNDSELSYHRSSHSSPIWYLNHSTLESHAQSYSQQQNEKEPRMRVSSEDNCTSRTRSREQRVVDRSNTVIPSAPRLEYQSEDEASASYLWKHSTTGETYDDVQEPPVVRSKKSRSIWRKLLMGRKRSESEDF